jgi:uncharacterized protein YprB with RNaseH-like and TPR domain
MSKKQEQRQIDTKQDMYGQKPCGMKFYNMRDETGRFLSYTNNGVPLNTAREKIGFLDIESTGLTASYGLMMSYCIKEMDGPLIENRITTKEMRSKVKDSRLVADLCRDILKFDRIATYYGTGFDIKFSRARALLWDLDFPLYKSVKHTDVYYIVKHKIKLHSHRLGAVCEFFGIPSKEHRLDPLIWADAMVGEEKALKYVLLHNREDVICLETLYKKLNGHFQINKRSI